MAPSPLQQNSARQRGRRILLVLGGAVIFLGAASVIKPTPQSASAAPDGRGQMVRTNGPGAANPTHHAKGWKLIGSLEGHEHVVKCWATPDGPRYSVYTLDGRLVQDELPADEVYRGFPDVDLPNLLADPPEGGPLMLVETDKD